MQGPRPVRGVVGLGVLQVPVTGFGEPVSRRGVSIVAGQPPQRVKGGELGIHPDLDRPVEVRRKQGAKIAG